MKELLKSAAVIALILVFVPLASFVFVKDTDGYFSVYDTSSGKIKKFSEREYVSGALASEMPPTFHIDALKAQAVAIYTNAFRARAAGEEYVCRVNLKECEGYIDNKTLKKQWGKSYDVYIKKIKEAVDSVFGYVIAYNNSPILAPYHSLSSGKTESAENVWGQSVPYLVAVDSVGDTYNANLETTKSISSNEVRKKLSSAFPEAFLPQDDSMLFTDFNLSPSGTVLSCLVGNVNVSGHKIRELFSLRSSCFSVKAENGSLTFTVSGYGHGVGMSQYGADFMARQGKNFKEIISHYYSTTHLMLAK